MPERVGYSEWLKKMRELLEAGGPTAVRTFVGEHMTETEAKNALAWLLVYFDSYETMRDVLRGDPDSGESSQGATFRGDA
jgi:hypothetical protein